MTVQHQIIYLEITPESLKLAKENYKLTQNLANSKSTPKHKSLLSSYRAGYKRRYDAEVLSSYSSSTKTYLNYQDQKKTSVL